MPFLALRQLGIRVVGSQKTTLAEHPIVQALNADDETIFERYKSLAASKRGSARRRHHAKKDSETWTGLKELASSLREKGLRICPDHDVVFKNHGQGWYCTHGRHRMCAARHVWGSGAMAEYKVVKCDTALLVGLKSSDGKHTYSCKCKEHRH